MESELVELFRGVVRLETELWSRADAAVQASHGIPLTWLEILQTIDAIPGCRVLDITHALAITVGGASKIVDRVERAGLCRREPCPTDARSNTITLTPAGDRMLADANHTFEATLAELIEGTVSATELTRLTGTVQRLFIHLGRAADAGRPESGSVAARSGE